MTDFVNRRNFVRFASLLLFTGTHRFAVAISGYPILSPPGCRRIQIFWESISWILTREAVMIGVETRTSSPVRIPRDRESMTHIRLRGFYPCGEGAGYAGGIVSAAIDGERCAKALAMQIKQSSSFDRSV